MFTIITIRLLPQVMTTHLPTGQRLDEGAAPTGTLDSCKQKALEYSGIVLPHAPLNRQQRAAAAEDAQKLRAMDL